MRPDSTRQAPTAPDSHADTTPPDTTLAPPDSTHPQLTPEENKEHIREAHAHKHRTPPPALRLEPRRAAPG